MTDEPKPRTPSRGAFLLPNLLTTGCLFAGLYAVVAAIDGNLAQGAMAIFIAMVFDGLDGRVARMTGTESTFGKEYDSLADMVAFGLAPAIVCYQWGVDRIAEYGLAWGRLGWVAAFFYTAAGALRLARFNVRVAADKRYFEGLPSPSAAAVVAAFVWLATKYGLDGLPALVLGFLVTATAGALMVSRVSYASFKHRATSERVLYSRLLLIPLVFSLIAINPPVALLLLFGSYAASAPLLWAWRRLTRRTRRPRED